MLPSSPCSKFGFKCHLQNKKITERWSNYEKGGGWCGSYFFFVERKRKYFYVIVLNTIKIMRVLDEFFIES